MASLEVVGLRVKIGDGAGEGPVDLDVCLLGERPWPGKLLDAPERLCYTDPEIDPASGSPIIRVWEHGEAFYRLRYWDASEFLIDRGGTRVWARWPAVVPEAEVRLCLLGPIIGFVLHLRGTPCLHASAVAVDGRAVAFLGHSGMGKSTTAAAFVRRGYRALTDDVLALDEKMSPGLIIQDSGSRFYVRPGHNLVRLWPDAVRALYGRDDALPAGGDTTDKRHLDLTGPEDAFHPAPLPLGAIYVLHERRDDVAGPVAIAPLKGHEALMALVARTYMNYVLDSTLRVRALTVFARLAAQVPIRQLIVRHDPAALGELTDAILDDFRTI